MSPRDLHIALLRPPILQILRAAGFTATRPAVLDTVVDLASRYLTLLASKTALLAQSNHNDLTPTIMDTRMALQDVGVFWPQISIMEEQVRDEEDMRGIEGFLEWMKGEANREIRRVAGLSPSDGEVIGTELEERVDFLTGQFSLISS
jgi:transcription initiation factor TFIID subunit 3